MDITVQMVSMWFVVGIIVYNCTTFKNYLVFYVCMIVIFRDNATNTNVPLRATLVTANVSLQLSLAISCNSLMTPRVHLTLSFLNNVPLKLSLSNLFLLFYDLFRTYVMVSLSQPCI